MASKLILRELEHSSPHIHSGKHLVYYIPGGNRDSISRQILDFKDGTAAAVKKWCGLAVEALAGKKFDYVVRILGHDTLNDNGSGSLSRLARDIAVETGASYENALLKKRHKTAKFSKGVDKAGRRDLLEGAYFLNPKCQLVDGKRLLVVDDVSTSSSTIDVIADKIHTDYPKMKIFVFTLAKTRHDAKANEAIEID